MIEIIGIRDLEPQEVCITPELRRTLARALNRHCRKVGNCEACEDKKRGHPCPYAGMPINWRV